MAQSEVQEVMTHKVKCYVNQDGMTVLRCPECRASRTIDTNNKNYDFKPFKARCKCGAVIRGQFEFRRHYRKKVRLAGFYKNRKTGKAGDILVEDISLSGAGFFCFEKPGFRKGDQLDLTFNLDNPMKSEIMLRVEVLHIKDKFIGVKRCDALSIQPELGFYLK